MKADFSINFDEVVHEPVLYGDFVAQTADKAYQEIEDVLLVNILIFFCFHEKKCFVFSDEKTFR
jgi:hypothetical protein